MDFMGKALAALVITITSIAPLEAQRLLRNHFAAQIAVGVPNPLGVTAEQVGRSGWVFVGSAGARLNTRVSLFLDFSLFDVERNVFRPGDARAERIADMRMWAVTLNPAFEFIREDRFGVYATGGYGVYRRRLATADSAPPGAYKGGFNVGTGVGLGAYRKVFVEVRYHRMSSTPEPTEALPVMLGFRW